ncbi:MAG TPA: FAD-dependent monooxygenase [Vitreimonas sp.]|nr:FAD-dependent monooxygenase [Vitreimonas sp.]
MKVLIEGGGIAGLASASFLADHGIQATIVEKAREFKSIGYGVSLWPNGLRMLRLLGLEEAVLKEAYPLKKYEIADAQGHVIHRMDFHRLFATFGKLVGIERAKLHHLLAKRAHKTPIRFATTILKIVQFEHGVRVYLSTGEVEEYDVVVGADGIHSQVRELVFRKTEPNYYGWTSWLFWMPEDIPHHQGIFQLLGTNAYVAFYPLSEKKCGVYMTAAVPPHQKDEFRTSEDKSLRKQKMKALFADFGWRVDEIIDRVDQLDTMFHDDIAMVKSECWYDQRVALMGDAEHALSPLCGMGSSIALEDAYVLAEELAQVDPQAVVVALERYRQRRQQRIRKLRRLSDLFTKLVMVRSRVVLWFITHIGSKILPRSFVPGRFERFLKAGI